MAPVYTSVSANHGPDRVVFSGADRLIVKTDAAAGSSVVVAVAIDANNASAIVSALNGE